MVYMSSALPSTFSSEIAFPYTANDHTKIALSTPGPITSSSEEIKRVLRPSARQITAEQAANAESKYRLSSASVVAIPPQAQIPSHIMLPYQTEIITSAYIINIPEMMQKLTLSIFVKWDNLDNRFHGRIVEFEGLQTLIQCIKNSEGAHCYHIITSFDSDTTVGAIERAIGNIFNADVSLLHDLERLPPEGILELYNDKLLQIYQRQESVQLSAFIWKNRHEEGFSANTQINSAVSSISESAKEKSLFKKLFSCC